MRRFVLFRFVYASAIFVSFTAAAEDIQIDYPRNLSEQVVNPTADATAMLRYQDCPVSYATGTADVSVPLLQFQYGEQALALAISYHTGGIKVDDPAGCIGLGWSLQGLGRVSRQICVMPDEKLGFMGAEEMNNPTAKDFYDLMFYKKIDNPQSKDANYDRYNYDIPGYSGSFIVDGGSIVDFSHNGVKIVTTISKNVPGTIQLITPEGTRYTFGAGGNIEKCSYKERVTDGVFKDYDRDYDNVPVTWMLTDITHNNMAGSIKIDYATSTAKQKERYIQTSTVTRTWMNQPSYTASTARSEDRGTTGTTTYTNRAIPRRICCFSDTIYFDLRTVDASSEDDKRMISAIRVINSQGKEVRRITFDNNSLFEDKRPRLDAVTITSDGQMVDKRKFEYNTGFKKTCSDFFGYANGIDNSLSIYSQTYIVNPETLTLNPEREFRHQGVYAWSLKKITDATGVETTFNYELNSCDSNGQTIYNGIRIGEIRSYDPITGRVRIREFSYSDPEMSIPLNMLTLRNFISLSGVKSYKDLLNPTGEPLKVENNESYSLSATFTSSSNNAGVPAEKMRIYYGKVTETISGTGMSPVKTDYVFDNTHCISTQLSYFPVYGSQNAQQRSSGIIEPGDRNRIKLGYKLYMGPGASEYYHDQSDFYNVFGYRESIVNFKEIACPQPLLVKKISYEYDSGIYRPLETTEKFYSSHDRFRFPVGIFVQSNVYKTYDLNEYYHNIYDRDCPTDTLASTLHERCWVYSERIRHDSTAVTRHYPDGNTRTVWQRHYYNNLLSKIENILYENPDTILPAPSDTLTFEAVSLRPVTTITGCGNDYLIRNTIRVRNIKIGPKVTGNYYEAIKDRHLGYTPVTDRWIVKSGTMTDSVLLKRVFAGFAYNSTIKPKYVTLGREASQNIAWRKFHGYNTCGNVTSMTENDGLLKNFTWDATGFLLTSKKIADLTTYYTWQPHVGCTSITEPSGRKHTFSYSGGRLAAECNTAGDTVATYGYSLYVDGGQNMTEKTVFGDKGGATTRVFYDGFGLPVQTVAVNGSGDGSQHVSTYMTYDGLDRPLREYRPVPLDEAGAMTGHDDFASLASSFYGGDSRPFTATAYLASAGEKVAAVYSPGAAFADHPARMSYLCNNTTDPELKVRRYTLFNHPMGEGVRYEGFWPGGTLDAVKSVDPDGHTLLTFTDWKGYKILERRKLSDSDFIDTYYINNVWGEPLIVIQPEAANIATRVNDMIEISSNESLARNVFVYRYDRCGRLIYSRVPGCEPVEYRYDRYGRLAFMQDGNMRAAGRAMFTVYDEASRVAVTGMCDDDAMSAGVSIPSMTAPFDNSYTFPGICSTGYLVNALEYLQNAELLTATYYDNYDFCGLGLFDNLPDDPSYTYAPAKGLVTGTLSAVLGNADSDSNIPPIAAVTFYDNEDRPVRTFSTTHLVGTYEQTETTYTLDGQPKTVSHTLTKGDKTYADDYEYAYDNVGRLSDTKAAFPGRESKVGIVKNYYNSTGLLHRTVNDTIQTDYGYDIRGSIRMVINDRVYQQILRNPSGSISYIMENWIEHIYEYDNAGRLLSEVCDCGGSLGGVFSSSYIYDKNSNITGVIRKGYPKGSHPPGTVDDLTLSYRGNQLVRAGDMADEVLRERSFDFQDGAEEDIEYRYDANGNLTFDANRGITDITYNVLNLPSKILLCDGTSINYIYDASGAKRATTHEIEDGSAAAPSEFGMFPYWPFSDSVIERDYLGNYEFRGGSLLRINTSYGYYTPRNAAFTPYLRDYQGNNRNSAVYYAYGLPTSYTSYNVDDPYLYGGKRLEAYKGLNIYDFHARTYTPDIVRFMQPDPKAHAYHWLSPYAYCGGDPINNIDPDGRWTVKVSASQDREKNPYAVFTAYDRHQNIIYRTVVKAKGAHRDRSKTNGDTPQGLYKILEWRETNNDRYPADSFGPEFLLATHYEGGEGENRDGMHGHGGGYGGAYQKTELKGTNGCIRMSDEDIAELKNITDYIEKKDPQEKPGYMVVKNDLKYPVKYSDREDIKEFYFYLINLDEIIVIYNR